ncbi:hypothetical protein HYALB_00003543 [Hymenoscyphus albidus]|uniref:Altered inheritance of mitochondria protein 11 n=1 Tax=Hymenoscyphus albidus TaxID=595503 RepID=A0A9N9QCA8_9HELO|nr:hypothetical protein HYALB_00003543 [Hymenoscyphus albidus]
MAFLQQPTMAQPLRNPQPQPQPSEQPESRSFFSQRSARQFGLFAAGVGFFALSTVITRRSLVRKYKATVPRFYHPSNRVAEVNGGLEAVEALGLATVNVASVAMTATGGLLWAFDISTLDDLRRKVRKQMGFSRTGNSLEDKEAEEEIEEWFAEVLSRKEFKHLKGKEAENMEKETKEEEKKS